MPVVASIISLKTEPPLQGNLYEARV